MRDTLYIYLLVASSGGKNPYFAHPKKPQTHKKPKIPASHAMTHKLVKTRFRDIRERTQKKIWAFFHNL